MSDKNKNATSRHVGLFGEFIYSAGISHPLKKKKKETNKLDFARPIATLPSRGYTSTIRLHRARRAHFETDVLSCILFIARADATKAASPKNQVETQPPSVEQRSASGGSNTSNTGKQRVKSQKRREAQQAFQNSWLIGALKGHTGLILDMDLSQNGKYLASSAEGTYI